MLLCLSDLHLCSGGEPSVSAEGRRPVDMSTTSTPPTLPAAPPPCPDETHAVAREQIGTTWRSFSVSHKRVRRGVLPPGDDPQPEEGLMPTCPGCLEPLPAHADPRRRTCSNRCRQRLRHARRAETLTQAHDLLQRQTVAILSGDSEALAAVVAEADAFFAV